MAQPPDKPKKKKTPTHNLRLVRMSARLIDGSLFMWRSRSRAIRNETVKPPGQQKKQEFNRHKVGGMLYGEVKHKGKGPKDTVS